MFQVWQKVKEGGKVLVRNKKTDQYYNLTDEEYLQIVNYHLSRNDHAAARNLEIVTRKEIIETPEEITQIVKNDNGRKIKTGEFPKKDSGKKSE